MKGETSGGPVPAKPSLWRRVIGGRWGWLAALLIAACLISATVLSIDVVSGAMKGWMRWRLDDGSLLTLSTGSSKHQATLKSKSRWMTMYFDAALPIRTAECRCDGNGTYWIVTHDGEKPSIPVYVTGTPLQLLAPGFGPGHAPERFETDSGQFVPHAWFSLISP